jgi:hypothetical protein
MNDLSNEELAKIAGVTLKPMAPQATTQSPSINSNDYSHLTDDDLARIAGVTLKPDNTSLTERTLGAIGDFGQGAISGLGNIGSGLIQRASELGGNTTGVIARNILPLIRPDLADELSKTTSEDVRKSAGNVGANLDKEVQEKGGSFELGKTVGEIAPLLGVGGGGLIGTGATAGALSGFSKPVQADNKLDSIIQSFKNTASDAALGAATGGIIKGAQAIPGAVKAGARSITGINDDAIKAFQDTGINPNLAAVSDSGAIKTIQNTLSRFPGSASLIERSIEKTKNDISNRLAGFGLDKGVTPQQAGEVIESGIKSGIERGKQKANQVYNIFERYVKPTDSFTTPNSLKFLDDVNQATSNPQVLKDLQNRDAFKVITQMANSTDNGMINYQDMKYFRNKIGSMLGDKFTVGDQERGLLKQAYGALTQDMRDAAASKGDKALKAFDKSNELYSKFISNTEDNLAGVLNKNAPEQMFQAMLQGTKIGGTKANAIMGGLNADQREIVRGSIMQNLGKTMDGEFDPVKMIKEFNKLSPEAQTAFFKGTSSDTVNSFNMIRKAVGKLDNVKEFGNPSGSGHISNMALFLGGSALSPLKAGLAVAGSNISARLMTNPKFINWLAQGVKSQKTPQIAAKHFEKLSQIVKASPELEDDVMHYLNSTNNSTNVTNNNLLPAQ